MFIHGVHGGVPPLPPRKRECGAGRWGCGAASSGARRPAVVGGGWGSRLRETETKRTRGGDREGNNGKKEMAWKTGRFRV